MSEPNSQPSAAATTTATTISDLDDDTLNAVLECLPLADLLSAEQVCRRWRSSVASVLRRHRTIAYHHNNGSMTYCTDDAGHRQRVFAVDRYERLNTSFTFALETIRAKFPAIVCADLRSKWTLTIQQLCALACVCPRLQCVYLPPMVYGPNERLYWQQFVRSVADRLLHVDLNLSNSRLTDSHLRSLFEWCQSLREVVIFGRVSAAAFAGPVGPDWRKVQLNQCGINRIIQVCHCDAIVTQLSAGNARNISEFHLNIPYSTADLDLIGVRFAGLRKLSLAAVESDSYYGARTSLAVHLKQLTHLRLNLYRIRLTKHACDSFVLAIIGFGSSSLRTLDVRSGRFSAKTLNKVFAVCPRVENLVLFSVLWQHCVQHLLHMDANCQVCAESLKFWHFLGADSAVRQLMIRFTIVPKAMVTALASLANLTRFDFESSGSYAMDFFDALVRLRLLRPNALIVMRVIERPIYHDLEANISHLLANGVAVTRHPYRDYGIYSLNRYHGTYQDFEFNILFQSMNKLWNE